MVEGSGRASFREVRRLAYLRLACDIVAAEKSSEIDLACEKFVHKARSLNKDLERYTRSTGRIERISVARSHFVIAKTLGLVQIEGEFVKSTGMCAFFASLPKNDGNPFYLTREEKLSFFEELFRYKGQDLFQLLQLFDDCTSVDFEKARNRMRKDTRLHVDQIVKSGLDWFVDMDLLNPTSAKKGKFNITETGRKLRNLLGSDNLNRELSEYFKIYAENLLGPVSSSGTADDNLIVSSFYNAVEKTRKYAASEISRDLLSALPVVRFTRLILLMQHRILLSVDQLTTRMKELLPKEGVAFKWEGIYVDTTFEGGYIRL